MGTLYQYFPNKSALLQAALRRHLNEVSKTIERVCQEQQGGTLGQMGTAVVNAFLQAKMRDAKTSVALYAVSSDMDGAKVVRQAGVRSNRALVEMLLTARDPLRNDPQQLVAAMLQSAMAEVSRRLLESEVPKKQLGPLRQELLFLVGTYLEACSGGR